METTIIVTIALFLILVIYVVAMSKIGQLEQDNIVLRSEKYDLEHENERMKLNFGKIKSRVRFLKQTNQSESAENLSNGQEKNQVTSEDK